MHHWSCRFKSIRKSVQNSKSISKLKISKIGRLEYNSHTHFPRVCMPWFDELSRLEVSKNIKYMETNALILYVKQCSYFAFARPGARTLFSKCIDCAQESNEWLPWTRFILHKKCNKEKYAAWRSLCENNKRNQWVLELSISVLMNDIFGTGKYEEYKTLV